MRSLILRFVLPAIFAAMLVLPTGHSWAQNVGGQDKRSGEMLWSYDTGG